MEQESYTFVAGEWSTFNDAIKTLEAFADRPMPRTQHKVADLEAELNARAGEEKLTDRHEELQIEEMMAKSLLLCPKEKVQRQREKFFSNLHFSTLKELLLQAKEKEFI